jgi:flagellar hook-length control protein FliK
VPQNGKSCRWAEKAAASAPSKITESRHKILKYIDILYLTRDGPVLADTGLEFHRERPHVVSVTSEVSASLSFQATQRPSRNDPSQASDSFGALVDSNAAAASNAAGNNGTTSSPQAPSAAPTQNGAPSSSSGTSATNPAGNDDSNDSNAESGPASNANTTANAGVDAATVQQPNANTGATKAGTAKTTDKTSSDDSSATDPTLTAQQGALLATLPNTATIVAPVIVASSVPAASPATPPPATGTGTTPLAIAAAGIAATSTALANLAASPTTQTPPASQTAPAAPSPATPAGQVDATATATLAASDAASVTAVVAATTTAKAAVQSTTSAAVAPPVNQPPAQSSTNAASAATTTTAATNGTLNAAVAATVPVTPKATLLNAPSTATPAKTNATSAASGATSGASDPSATAAPGQTTDNFAAQASVAAKPEAGNGSADTAPADPSTDPSSTLPAAASAHEHSPTTASGHTLTDPSDAGAPTTGLIQPPQVSNPANAGPVGSLGVTAATSAAVPLSGLAVEIAASARSGNSRFEIRLDPADLGRIDVRIDVDRNGQVTSHLTVEKPETLSLLRQDAPQLQQALNDAGLKTSNGGLQFSLRDQSSGQNNGNANGRNAQHVIVSEESTVPAAIAGRSYGRLSGASGGVDIRV